jgi:hypothetical protein
MAVLIAVGISLPGSWAKDEFDQNEWRGWHDRRRGSLVVLLPEEWQWKAFRAGAIDIGDHLARGKWPRPVLHLVCPRCVKLIDVSEIGRGSCADSGSAERGQDRVFRAGAEAADDPEIATSECLLGK